LLKLKMNRLGQLPVFNRISKSRGFLALLIPLTFVWSWAACTLLCGEITAHREEQSFSASAARGEKCLAAFDTEHCPVTKAGAAVVEARQTFFSHASPALDTAFRAPREFLSVRVDAYPADVNQNSPPRFSSDPPLFLRHCAFRI
jgi:hypothetical protein